MWRFAVFTKLGYFFLLKLNDTNLQRRSLISQTVEDATATAQQVIHPSVCVVQVGVEL